MGSERSGKEEQSPSASLLIFLLNETFLFYWIFAMKSQQTLCLPALTNVCMHVPAVHCKLWHVQMLQHWDCPFQHGIPACPAGRSWLVLPSFRREVIGIDGRVAGSVWWYHKKRSGGIAKWKLLIQTNTFQARFAMFLIAAKPDELSECVCAGARRRVTFTLHQTNRPGSSWQPCSLCLWG